MECESKSDTGNNRGDRNHLKITQTISEQHNRQARNRRTTKNSHIGHCTHTTESVDVKYKFHGRNNITYNTNCKYITAATIHNLETLFVSNM